MTGPDYTLLDSQLRDLLQATGNSPALYLTRETYSRERVSTLIVSP